ncbi:metallophosphoesterase family protein [Chelatococcus asaccharovorans]|uniref:metallophosphoesterase family protein n=1 Tax=Chelatococcus asaccharovorans TaxID=28210 RepID=UPI00224C6B88|nr:metallophosphoesterase [Chelatococcus asaccharovorans]CAH1660885.1 Calcineurin-like phosphoesterase family protein [Chelatococcus asaccharovorans]CAH1683635.1 Calcineurin-like phosphoesterase family protein [Chelatococcus asaccharovorans]
MYKVIHISDTHLRESNLGSLVGWTKAVRAIAATQPDLVIHTGDIVLDEPDNATDHAFARSELANLAVEWLAIPGNHDIGDGPPRQESICSDLIHRFADTYGATHWTRDIGPWLVIGVNAMLFGLGTAQEDEEWAWLEKALSTASGKPVALFMHKPPFVTTPDDVEHGSAAIPPASRGHLWALVRRYGVQVIACGHRHEYRVLHRDGVTIVWAPTTSDQLDELTSPINDPIPLPGLVEMIFHEDTFIHRFVPFYNRTAND